MLSKRSRNYKKKRAMTAIFCGKIHEKVFLNSSLKLYITLDVIAKLFLRSKLKTNGNKNSSNYGFNFSFLKEYGMTQKIYDLFYLFSRFLFLIDKIETKILSIYEMITHQKCPLTLMENYFRVN